MDKERSQRFMLKVVDDVGTALAASLVHLGDRTGLFRAMAGAGPLTAQTLADKTGIHPRYVEEWLATMVGARYLEHDPEADTFLLPDEHALFLVDSESEYYLGGLLAGLPSLMSALPLLEQAFRKGGGVAFADYGGALPLALESMNRSVYRSRLVRTWLPAMPEVLARLQAGGSAIDLGCGTGVVPVTLAAAFPQARFAGLDLDPRSIEIARESARSEGVAERVTFIQAPIERLPADRPWDFISTFDVVHDLPEPDAALRAIRAALAEGGTYLMVEPKVADRLEKNTDNPFARMLYGISCLHCVPQSLAQGGPGLGACWGPAEARRRAREAGFSRFDQLDIRSPALAFYALRA